MRTCEVHSCPYKWTTVGCYGLGSDLHAGEERRILRLTLILTSLSLRMDYRRIICMIHAWLIHVFTPRPTRGVIGPQVNCVGKVELGQKGHTPTCGVWLGSDPDASEERRNSV